MESLEITYNLPKLHLQRQKNAILHHLHLYEQETETFN